MDLTKNSKLHTQIFTSNTSVRIQLYHCSVKKGNTIYPAYQVRHQSQSSDKLNSDFLSIYSKQKNS